MNSDLYTSQTLWFSKKHYDDNICINPNEVSPKHLYRNFKFHTLWTPISCCSPKVFTQRGGLKLICHLIQLSNSPQVKKRRRKVLVTKSGSEFINFCLCFLCSLVEIHSFPEPVLERAPSPHLLTKVFSIHCKWQAHFHFAQPSGAPCSLTSQKVRLLLCLCQYLQLFLPRHCSGSVTWSILNEPMLGSLKLSHFRPSDSIVWFQYK